ncbi:hypothetical protein SLS60_010052 [Paraconiothyrium brasiliense]|uniref:Uncharacterized protein n=1 Tax=Paraconiothyrium brasiliense TaxID=300254 RepID=A0ABR3QQ57_9PLEO
MGDRSPEPAELDPDIAKPDVVTADKLPDPSTFELDIVMQEEDAVSNGPTTPLPTGKENRISQTNVTMDEDNAQLSGPATPKPKIKGKRKVESMLMSESKHTVAKPEDDIPSSASATPHSNEKEGDALPDPWDLGADVAMDAEDAESSGRATPNPKGKGKEKVLELDVVMEEDDAQSSGSLTPRASTHDKGKEKAEAPRLEVSLWAGNTYMHFGDYEAIPDDAPPGERKHSERSLQFLKSYLPLVDGPHTDHRAALFNPSAMIKVNADPPLHMSRLIPLLNKRAGLPIQFSSKLYRAWAITNTGEEKAGYPVETLLVD